MGLKSAISLPFAKYIAKNTHKWSNNPHQTQQKVFDELIKVGRNTAYGREHNLPLVNNYQDFKNNVPICDYENIKPYIERIKKGESDVLWKGKPIYLSKTSG